LDDTDVFHPAFPFGEVCMEADFEGRSRP